METSKFDIADYLDSNEMIAEYLNAILEDGDENEIITAIGKYDLEFNGKHFILKNKKTACLAEDACGIPVTTDNKFRVIEEKTSCCTPNSGCC